MKNTKKQAMYNDIQRHGEQLNAIFNTGIEPVALCKKLRRLENKAHKIALDYCNGENGINADNIEEHVKPIMDKVYKVLNNGIYQDDRPHMRRVPVSFNGDARGYALKIKTDYVNALYLQGKRIYTDMGGYGILAPDFGGE